MRLAGFVLAAVAVLPGCSLQPTEVSDGGDAPTGIAQGPTLYFIGDDGALVAHSRNVGRLGTIAEALVLLFKVGPGGSDLGTALPDDSIPAVGVTIADDVIDLAVPFDYEELTPIAIDQIVCTAIAFHVQQGGSTNVRVRVGLANGTAEAAQLRTCPLIGDR